MRHSLHQELWLPTTSYDIEWSSVTVASSAFIWSLKQTSSSAITTVSVCIMYGFCSGRGVCVCVCEECKVDIGMCVCPFYISRTSGRETCARV